MVVVFYISTKILGKQVLGTYEYFHCPVIEIKPGGKKKYYTNEKKMSDRCIGLMS